ncbi:MAG: copper-translocating P-type ATPase [Cyanothece sp. SIO1E1]|nr:copper-translocating P-type ATPase [Cyanothece sp. SIO1E1]
MSIQNLGHLPVNPAVASAKLPTEVITLNVGGMKCAGCVRAVEQQLLQCNGVISATVNLATEIARVECDPQAPAPTRLAQILTEAGFPSQPRPPMATTSASTAFTAEADSWNQQQRLTHQQQHGQMAIASILLLLSGIGHLHQFGLDWGFMPGLSNIWFHGGLATLALIGPGRSILVDGWRGWRHHAPNMNTLVGMGALSAYLASVVALLCPHLGWECFFDEPVMLVSFILLGRWLEQRARKRAVASLQALIALQPQVTHLIIDPKAAVGTCTSLEVPTEQIQVGDWLQVLPGEKIPADGEVVTGQTTVDESMLTGESMPIPKHPGDLISTGTLNQSGAIIFKVTRTGQDTTLAQIIQLVETAQTRKAPVQRLADTVAGYFTYGVMAIALLTFLFWQFIGFSLWPDLVAHHGLMAMGHTHIGPSASPMAPGLMPMTSPLLMSLQLTIAVLVIACPCALGLATPTAILVGSGIGAERGLLIRGGDVLEKVHHLDVIVFDKTGTLTVGHPTVTDCLPLSEAIDASQLLQIAATVENGARHPLAVAIQQYAQQQALPLLTGQDFQTEVGLGASANINRERVRLGTRDWLAQQGIFISETATTAAQAMADAGKTVVYVAIGNVLIGLIAAIDTIRPEAKTTVNRLQQMGLKVIMLTGDQPTAAAGVAQSLGLGTHEMMANVPPDGKIEAIANLQTQGYQVAMVGDGSNDAPALAQADVGIALNSGTDVAIETADIVLIHDCLMDVVEAIRLSRATFNKIRQNLFWAFTYNMVGIPMAAGILLPSLGVVLSPAMAGVLMAFSSVSVVTNSLRLRHHTPVTSA